MNKHHLICLLSLSLTIRSHTFECRRPLSSPVTMFVLALVGLFWMKSVADGEGGSLGKVNLAVFSLGHNRERTAGVDCCFSLALPKHLMLSLILIKAENGFSKMWFVPTVFFHRQLLLQPRPQGIDIFITEKCWMTKTGRKHWITSWEIPGHKIYSFVSFFAQNIRNVLTISSTYNIEILQFKYKSGIKAIFK